MSKNTKNISILVIEDEIDLCEAMVSYLCLEGLIAHGVHHTQDAELWLKHNPVDIVIVDVGLPDKNGIDWLNDIKLIYHLGVIIATARGDHSDKLKGLQVGADSYLIKPVEYAELLLLIHNIYNRLHPEHNKSDKIRWILCPYHRTLTYQHCIISLSYSEFVLLKTMALGEHQIAKKLDIIEALGHSVENYDYRRLEILVRRLKNKIKIKTLQSAPINCIYAIGYHFSDCLLYVK